MVMERPLRVDDKDRQARFAPVCASGAEDAPLVEYKIDNRLIQDAIEICDRRYPTKPLWAGKQYAEFRASLVLIPKTSFPIQCAKARSRPKSTAPCFVHPASA
jgi:hypothetical protein